MIEKKTIIISSIGRTGTKFFAELFSDLFPFSTSLHEPDILTLGRQSSLSRQIKEIGFYYLLMKIMRNWSLVKVSDSFVTGTISEDEAVRKILRQRSKFIESRPGSLYVESSLGYYGVLDLLDQVFKDYRGVYIVRNGTEWVRSFMDRGLHKSNPIYNKNSLAEKFTHTWPKASDFDQDLYQDKWKSLSRFQKLCWAWTKLNNIALKSIANNPNIRLFYFEDIFQSKTSSSLAELVKFVSGNLFHEQTSPKMSYYLQKQPPNSSLNRYPSWSSWTENQKEFFLDTCKPLMDQLGYDI